MRIAVLDDDPAQVDFVGKTLSAAGHICVPFSAGRGLVKRLRRETFDLLVLDWNVPDLSGADVLQWIRHSLPERPLVLFMTCRAREDDVTSMLNAGADDYVVKPVSAALLLARIGSLLRRSYQTNTAPSRELFNDFEFNSSAKEVSINGNIVCLTQKEFELGLLLFQPDIWIWLSFGACQEGQCMSCTDIVQLGPVHANNGLANSPHFIYEFQSTRAIYPIDRPAFYHRMADSWKSGDCHRSAEFDRAFDGRRRSAGL